MKEFLLNCKCPELEWEENSHKELLGKVNNIPVLVLDIEDIENVTMRTFFRGTVQFYDKKHKLNFAKKTAQEIYENHIEELIKNIKKITI
jgi:hypothetical protein